MIIGITGGSGVIGKILIEKLKNRQCVISKFEGDIAERKQVEDWVNTSQPAILIHLAAIVPIATVNENRLKTYDVNISGTINLLHAVSKLKDFPWLFYASTSHVYRSSVEPINESHHIAPINTYGLTKYISEQILQDYTAAGGHPLCIGRIFSFFHPTQKEPFLYPSIIKRLSVEDLTKPFHLHGAKSVRDLMNAEQVCDKILALLDRRAKGVFNIGSGKGITIKDFVQSLTPQQLDFSIQENESVNYLVADITKYNKEIDGK